MKKSLLFLVYLFCHFYGFGQEGLFSQPFESGLLLNPALLGTHEAKNRIGGVYRTQWKIEESPYENYALFYEAQLKNFKYGIIINQNKTGDVGFKKTSIMLASGLSRKLGAGNNKLSFGAQFGLYQMHIDYVKLQFDNQYNPEVGFDGSLGSGENFEATNLIQPDINIGLTADFESNTDLKIEGQVGLSIIHINTPGRTFNKDQVVLPMKIIFHAKAFLHLNEFWGLEPQLIYASQDLEKEKRIGLNARFNLIDENQLTFGVAHNLENKFAFLTQFGMRRFSIGLSIDANVSKLNQSISDNNTFELLMTYNLQEKALKTHHRDVFR